MIFFVRWIINEFEKACELIHELSSCATLIVTPSLVGHGTVSQWCVLQHQLRPHWRDTWRSLRGSKDGGDPWRNPAHAQRIPNSGWGARFEAVWRWKTKDSYRSGYLEKPTDTNVRWSNFITGFNYWNGKLLTRKFVLVFVVPTFSVRINGDEQSVERVLKSLGELQLYLKKVRHGLRVSKCLD